MKTLFASRSLRWLLLFALGLGCLPLFSAGALAADAPVVASASLHANVFLELVADRTRLIQVSLVFVVVGIWMLWWRH
jgi:Na+/H+ antiporter NhaB